MSRVHERVRTLSIGGAVITALAASSCCIGPLVLALLGIGGAGAVAAFGAYRPWLLGFTGVLLALGFYLTYRKPGGSDACGCELSPPRARRAARVGLWFGAAVVLALAAAPPILAAATRSAPAPAAGQQLARATIAVRGIDCEACSTLLRDAMKPVGGFHDLTLDIPHQTVRVTFEPAPGRLERYVAAIDATGYEASLPPSTPSTDQVK